MTACAGQLRAGFGGPYALDYGAVMAFAQARRADIDLLTEVLPSVESAILKAFVKKDDDTDADTESGDEADR